jgi:predicted phage terminase large subunit-like protein
LRELYILLLADERARCERSYYEFFKSAWRVLEPNTPFDDNWHIKYLCDLMQKEVERIAAHKIKYRGDIIINIPPRAGKSYICTVMLTPWIWTKHPHFKVINSSYSMELSTKLCLDSRRLIDSAWYQALWSGVYQLTSDQNTKSWYENNRGGMRKSTSTGAAITGTGCDILIVDDPQNQELSDSEVERETVKRYFGKTLYSRLNNQRVGLRIVIQQRLHEDDLTGHLLANNRKQYRFICIPAMLDDNVSPPELVTQYKDGLFFPARFSRDVLENAKLSTNLGAFGFSAQMQQKPSPETGGLFKKYWWKFWKPAKSAKLPDVMYKNDDGEQVMAEVVDLPEGFEQVIDSWDTALDGLTTSDDVAGGKWGKNGAQKYLLNQKCGKMNFPETKKAIIELRDSNRATSAVLIERSANGPAIKSDLELEIPGIITIPTGKLSKEDRVKISDTAPYTAQVEAGNVFLPHPSLFPWVEGFVEEHANFPKSKQDGQVDQSAQAINYLTTRKNVWPNYRPMDTRHRRVFSLIWEYYYNIGAIYLGTDMQLSLVCGLWDRKNRHLYIYGESIMHQSAVNRMAAEIYVGMKLEYRDFRGLFGNVEMFGEFRSVSELLNTELKRMCVLKRLNKTIAVREPYEYDRNGALALVNLMFSRHEITIHSNLGEVSRQCSMWYVDKDKPAAGYELCEALSMLVFELNRVEKITIPIKTPTDYPAKKGELPPKKNMFFAR